MNNLQLIKSNLTDSEKTLSILEMEEQDLQLQKDSFFQTSSKLIQEFRKELLNIKNPNLNKLDSVSFDIINYDFNLELDINYHDSKLYFKNVKNTYNMLVSKINNELENPIFKNNIFWLVYQLDFTNGNLKPFTKINEDLTFPIYQNSLDLTDSNILVEKINSESLNFTQQLTNHQHNLFDIQEKSNKIRQELNDIIVLWKNNNLWKDNIGFKSILEEIKSKEIEIKNHEEFENFDIYFKGYLQNEKDMEENNVLLATNLKKKIELHNTHKQLTYDIKILKETISHLTPSGKKLLNRNNNIITKKKLISQDKYNIDELLFQQTKLHEKLDHLNNVLRDTKLNMSNINTKLTNLEVTIKQSDKILLNKYNLQKEDFLNSKLKLEIQSDKTQLEIKNTKTLLSFLKKTILIDKEAYQNKYKLPIENKTIKVDYCEEEYNMLKLELKDFLVSSQNLEIELEQLQKDITICQDKKDIFQKKKEKYFEDIKSNALWLVFQDRLLLLEIEKSYQKYKSLKNEELEINKIKNELFLKEYQIEEYSNSFTYEKKKLNKFIIKLGEIRYYILQLLYLEKVSELFSLKIDVEKFWEPILLEYDVTKKIIESKYIKEINKDNELLNNNNATNNNATNNNEKNGILEQYYIKINNLVRDYYYRLEPLTKQLNDIISKKFLITEKINKYKLLKEELLEIYNYMLNTDTYNFI
jgi:hypothetical protein